MGARRRGRVRGPLCGHRQPHRRAAVHPQHADIPGDPEVLPRVRHSGVGLLLVHDHAGDDGFGEPAAGGVHCEGAGIHAAVRAGGPVRRVDELCEHVADHGHRALDGPAGLHADAAAVHHVVHRHDGPVRAAAAGQHSGDVQAAHVEHGEHLGDAARGPDGGGVHVGRRRRVRPTDEVRGRPLLVDVAGQHERGRAAQAAAASFVGADRAGGGLSEPGIRPGRLSRGAVRGGAADEHADSVRPAAITGAGGVAVQRAAPIHPGHHVCGPRGVSAPARFAVCAGRRLLSLHSLLLDHLHRLGGTRHAGLGSDSAGFPVRLGKQPNGRSQAANAGLSLTFLAHFRNVVVVWSHWHLFLS